MIYSRKNQLPHDNSNVNRIIYPMGKKKIKTGSTTIALNKKVKHDYFIYQKYEAGLVLLGWEVKSLRAGRISLTDTYVYIKSGEAWLAGTNISPLPNASKHIASNASRTRKLLLNNRELLSIDIGVNQKGFTCVCTAFYWKNHLAKCEIALAKGKALYDKRSAEKEKVWNLQKQRLTRHRVS